MYASATRTTSPISNHIVHIFWPDRHYNAEVFWTSEWHFRGYYLNLALPHTWDGQLCSYVDLELDVCRFEGEAIKILDQDEYDAMRSQHSFPEDLELEVQRSVQQARQLLEREIYPFDGTLLAWRPGRNFL
jgi:protein associated with RNAse G/E